MRSCKVSGLKTLFTSFILGVYNDQTNKTSPIIQFPFEAARGRISGQIEIHGSFGNKNTKATKRFENVPAGRFCIFALNLPKSTTFWETKTIGNSFWGRKNAPNSRSGGLGKVFLDSPRFSPRPPPFLLDSPRSFLGPSSILLDSLGSSSILLDFHGCSSRSRGRIPGIDWNHRGNLNFHEIS